ncbi:MAG: methionine--tRNA ligase [Pseudobdellovibrionaceae bacterium]
MQRRILMTTALPYANGQIHIGHLVEYLQADFWSRFQKMQGHECVFVCADDTHGTPIMVKAREQGITPEALIAKSYDEHVKDFGDFLIQFDHYSSTNSADNRRLCEEFYQHMKAKNHIAIREIHQLYCDHDKMFLPDRFVKGTCPKCGALNQYGDSCDICGSTYSPEDMKDAKCSVCSNTPVKKPSEHYFFQLNHFKEELRQWLPDHTSNEIHKKMLEWFNEDLRDWDISRDEPYFGFAIPGTDNKKFFYVWVDAPIGYIASTTEWCAKNQRQVNDFWKNQDTEIYHFIGKDIVYFHTLFWPALLKAAEYQTPKQVFVHGHLMVNGEKMSKSKGTFIAARTYLQHLQPEYLRYYYGSKLGSSAEDIDLNLNDFVSRVNSDLVGKITNLASRGASMLGKNFSSQMVDLDTEGLQVVKAAQEKSAEIAALYEQREFAKAVNEIRGIADSTNKYFDEKAPWKLIKENPAQTQKILTSTLNAFRIIAIYLRPILPTYADNVGRLFGEPLGRWTDAQTLVQNKSIQAYEHLMTRIDPKQVQAMVDASVTAPPSAKK